MYLIFSEMTDIICTICQVGFENVPEKEIFNFKCNCKDSQYHSGCIKLLRDTAIEKQESYVKCPLCNNINMIHVIDEYLNELAGINNKNSMEPCFDWMNKWNIKITYVKSLFKGNSTRDIKLIQSISIIMSIVWLVYTIFRTRHQHHIDISEAIKEQCNDTVQKNECENNVKKQYAINRLIVLLYYWIILGALFTLNFKRMGKMLDFGVHIICMIIEVSLWQLSIDRGVYKDVGTDIVLYLLIYNIFIVVIGFIIYVSIWIGIILWNDFMYPYFVEKYYKNEEDNKNTRDNYPYKDGYDYEGDISFAI